MLQRWHWVTGLAILFLGIVCMLHKHEEPRNRRADLNRKWMRLGLSPEQTDRLATIQEEHRQKMNELRRRQREAILQVLTPAQRERLETLGEPPG